jgi:hypothetical protein
MILDYSLSLPIVMFATIFFKTVFRFWYFLSFASAACSSARNSYMIKFVTEFNRLRVPHLDLSALEEFGILTVLRGHRKLVLRPLSSCCNCYSVD